MSALINLLISREGIILKENDNNYLKIILIAILLIGFAFIIYLYDNPITRNIGDLSDWVGSLLTIGVLYIAFYQIYEEKKKIQEEKLFQEKEKRREQAVLIYSYLKEQDKIVIVNNSDYPIYDIVAGAIAIPVTYNDGYGNVLCSAEKYISLSWSKDLYRIHSIPPKSEEIVSIKRFGGGCGRVPGSAIAFRDTRNGYWVRETSGILVEIDNYKDYFHYEIPMELHMINGEKVIIPRC